MKFIKLLVVFFITSTMLACQQADQQNKKLRVGWQIPLANQGQIVSILKNTSILDDLGLEVEFVPFSFGSPQVEAAKAGSLDIIFVGDQPAINLIASGAKWKLSHQLFETRVAIMIPSNEELSGYDIADKTIASPFGSVAHREAVLYQQSKNLDSNQIKNVNVDILEISEMTRSSDNWGEIDAVAVWEPTVSVLEQAGLAKVLYETKTLGVVAMTESVLSDHKLTKQFETALYEAWSYFIENEEQANKWYIEDTNLGYTNSFLTYAMSIDRNGKKESTADISLDFTEKDKKSVATAMNWSFNQGYAKDKLPTDDFFAKKEQ